MMVLYLIKNIIISLRCRARTIWHFWRETLPELLEEIPADDQPQWFQHDGAPSHYTRAVVNHLNDRFPGRWLGRNGPQRWPPRSPDLTPLDFFLWGHIKKVVYATEPIAPEEVVAKIWAVQATITEEQLQGVRRNLLLRCQKCLDANGGTFEQISGMRQ